jgi:hypothetical protein
LIAHGAWRCSMESITSRMNKIISVSRTLGAPAFTRLLLDTLFSINHYYILGKSLASPPKCTFPQTPKGEFSHLTGNDMGQGYLLFCTQKLFELTKRKKYTSAICYIRTDRITSLSEFTKMGSRIIKIVKNTNLLTNFGAFSNC